MDWYDYGARMYDATLGRFHTQDRFAEKYYKFSPYQYVGNNPILNIDVNGDSILTLSGSFKLTTGKVGAKLSALGFAAEGSYTKGGAELEISFFLKIDTETGALNIGAKHTQKDVAEAHSVKLGAFGGSESEEKSTTRELSVHDGATKEEEKTYNKKESVSIGPLTSEETKDGNMYSLDFNTGAEVNVGIFGVGFSVNAEYDPGSNTDEEP